MRITLLPARTAIDSAGLPVATLAAKRGNPMTRSKPDMPTAIVLSAVVMLGALATVALVANFSESHTFGALWPGVERRAGAEP
ncbi:MAG: hypothetical protein M0C28_41170 [Candidatus Moduliflexus flocculans]|nr:hypothetical protein [Candidatus Moduliflexus flocculans]